MTCPALPPKRACADDKDKKPLSLPLIPSRPRHAQNDVSRLVDISRHTIFFETFTDLTMCLGEIVTDFDVKVSPNPYTNKS